MRGTNGCYRPRVLHKLHIQSQNSTAAPCMEEYNADENCFDLAQHHKLVPSGRNARSWRLRQQQTSHHHTLAASLSSLSRFISNATFRLSIPCPVGQWDPVGCFSGLSLDYPGTLCFPSRAWRMPPSFSRMVTWPMQNVLGLAMGTSLAMHA